MDDPVDGALTFDVDFVFFDLDDTLLDHRHAERLALNDLAREIETLVPFRMESVEEAYHRVNQAVWEEYGAGRIDKAEAKRARFERLFDVMGIDGPDAADTGDRYLELYARHWRPRQGALEAFSDVADRLRVGILTNGFREIQRAKLARFPDLDTRSAATIISEEIGLMKPDRRLFEWAAAHVGTQARRILYVGDSLRSDIRGGLAAGWQVAWIDGDPARAPTDAFCFSEWPDLLARI